MPPYGYDTGYFPPFNSTQIRAELFAARIVDMAASEEASTAAPVTPALEDGGVVLGDSRGEPVASRPEVINGGEVEDSDEEGGEIMLASQTGFGLSHPWTKVETKEYQSPTQDSLLTERQRSCDEEEYSVEIVGYTRMRMEMLGVYELDRVVQRWRESAGIPCRACNDASNKTRRKRIKNAAMKELEEARYAKAGAEVSQDEEENESLFGPSIWASFHNDHVGLLRDSLRDSQSRKKELGKQNKQLESRLSSYRALNTGLAKRCVALRRRQQELWDENSELKMREHMPRAKHRARVEAKLRSRRVRGGMCGVLLLVGFWMWLITFSGL